VRDETVARSYAEALFEVARKHDGLESFAEGLDTVSALLEDNPSFRTFLETPRIDAADKKALLRKVFGDRLPQPLVNFLQVTVDKRRQRLIRDMAREYASLLDEHLGREHVEVTVARRLDDAALQEVGRRLSAILGKTAIPHQQVRPEILGGIVVRAGDTIYDGSVRRRLDGMRRKLVAAGTTAAAVPGD